MADGFFIIPMLISFLISVLFIPSWIKKAKGVGLMWDDMNKAEKVKVAGSGGIVTVLAFVIGILVFVAYRTFILRSDIFLIEMLALLASILFLAGIGLMDDLLGWRKGGLRRRHRLMLVAFAAIPLMAINAGKSEIGAYIFGTVELGILYPLIIIPIGIVGAATTFNFLAGFNGLEAGQGIILLSGLGAVAFFTGSYWLTVIALCMIAALIGFLTFNYYPAKVFPGDSLTYSVGGLVAIIASIIFRKIFKLP